MGLFDKIKQAKNFITGGGAVVSVKPENEVSDGNAPIKFLIECQVKDADLNAKNIYFKIRATEEVEVQDVDIEREEDGELRTVRENITYDEDTFLEEFEVAGEQVLKANETYNWEVEFKIPPEVYGTYRGIHAVHEWSAYAGIDVSGNDPDSGWVVFEVIK